MAQPAKVATPLDAVTGLVVQASVPEPVATDKVIGAEAVATTVPPEFSILTTGCALNTTPLSVVPGVVVKTSFKVPVMEMVPEVAAGQTGAGGAQREVAGGAGDLTPGEGGHA